MRSSLRAVLRKHAGPTRAVYAGADETGEPASPWDGSSAQSPDGTILDRDALRADLEVVRRSNNLWFGVCVALLCILFIATLWTVIAYLGHPRVVRAMVAALAVSTSVFVALMVRMWQQKCAAEYIISLAAHLDPVTMKIVIEILARHV